MPGAGSKPACAGPSHGLVSMPAVPKASLACRLLPTHRVLGYLPHCVCALLACLHARLRAPCLPLTLCASLLSPIRGDGSEVGGHACTALPLELTALLFRRWFRSLGPQLNTQLKCLGARAHHPGSPLEARFSTVPHRIAWRTTPAQNSKVCTFTATHAAGGGGALDSQTRS